MSRPSQCAVPPPKHTPKHKKGAAMLIGGACSLAAVRAGAARGQLGGQAGTPHHDAEVAPRCQQREQGKAHYAMRHSAHPPPASRRTDCTHNLCLLQHTSVTNFAILRKCCHLPLVFTETAAVGKKKESLVHGFCQLGGLWRWMTRPLLRGASPLSNHTRATITRLLR